jgi:4-diphosphocytidyl-2-C-methyl-D-erythritol kinase
VNVFVTKESPAKINLILKVLGKRDDGFHEIASLMQRIDLHDDMSFALAGQGIALRCTGIPVPENSKNIVYRAAELFMQKTGRPSGVSIEIEKRIPTAAGLGGGSSNAATTLLALNELTSAGLDRDTLMAMGASIGSDVPFFIYGKAAWAFGRGERLEAAENIPPISLLVCNPGVPLATAEVYGNLRIGLTNEPIQYTIPRLQTVQQVARALENDLEEVSESLCPAIRDLKTSLADLGALGVLVSGSGPTVFGIFETREDVLAAGERLKTGMGVPFVAGAGSL